MIRFYSFFKSLLIISLRFIIILGYDKNIGVTPEDSVSWTGRWFPYGPGELDTNPVIHDEKHIQMMSEPDPECDNGKLNLNVDWDGSSTAHTCYTKKLFPDPYIKPMLTCYHIPKMYSAIHVCMNETIKYDEDIPTFGSHRPVWAQYGEYKYLPRQRWLHNGEHGAVIMLYHPCARKSEIAQLRYIVKNCLYRHIITPSPFVSEERPLVLVTWGCRFEMSYVHEPLVRAFVMNNALRGSEHLSKNGLYNESLIEPAEIVSDTEDTNLCPSSNHM